MYRLQSYVSGRWESGNGTPRPLLNPATEEQVAETTTEGIDFAAALTHARDVGGPALRALTFAQRGELLKAMSRALHEHREELIDLEALNNGATRGDAKFDVDGATGTLAWYARQGRQLGDTRWQVCGESEKLSSGARFIGQHVRLPRPGVAVHVNAFNFPGWGTFEKVAVALLSGMPIVSKPATATALTAWRMAQIIVEANILPEGAFSFIAGSTGDLLDHLGPQDCVAFTGSAQTGAWFRSLPAVRELSTRMGIEADSLNAAVLGPDVSVGDEIWHTFIRNIVKDMTQKTGQKCTAIRRVMVPEAIADSVAEALTEELARIKVGNPADSSVNMGPVATAQQLTDTRAGIELLSQQADIVCGGTAPVQGHGSPDGKGFFVSPTVLKARSAREATHVHQHEVFGPCTTILPYDGNAQEAADLVALGQGCLVSSVYTNERNWLGDFLMNAGPWNGRVQAVSKKVADQSLPPGMVLPNQIHGGPGRAGGGEELGGLRGMEFYTQRVAIQGDLGMLRKIFQLS